jgi:hypothetical protein
MYGTAVGRSVAERCYDLTSLQRGNMHGLLDEGSTVIA